ncbi:MAG: elongation factor Ts [Chitinivibrionales bacterium]|nr:elongation factor Ts [Chitinivibrionales bacterium]MBD3358593.1 elongation factor Ts [Chitinivibrionales bacterium]
MPGLCVSTNKEIVMAISATQVRELREATGLGMMACKKALEEADGDMEKAIESLRKQGQATAAKRAGKAAKEGKVSVLVEDGTALMYEVNSETDFVARNDDFVGFCEDLGTLLMKEKPASIEDAKALKSDQMGGQAVESKLMELVGKIGENISFRRFKIINADEASERLFTYIHGNGRIGVVVKLAADKAECLDSDAMKQLGKDVAMQVAAANPVAVNPEGLPQDLVAKEKDIYTTQAQSSGKPEKIWDRIVEGKLSKFYKEVALIEQAFIREPDISVTDRIKQTEKETGCSISVIEFGRYELGSEE